MTATDPTLAQLHLQAAADPEDDTVRLALADRLEEQDAEWVTCPECKGGREFVQTQSTWAGKVFTGKFTPCPTCAGVGTVADGSNAARAEFIRAQVELARQRTGMFKTSEANDRRQDWLEERAAAMDREYGARWRPACPGCGGCKVAFEDVEGVRSIEDCRVCDRSGLCPGRFSRGLFVATVPLEAVWAKQNVPCRHCNGARCPVCDGQGTQRRWGVEPWAVAAARDWGCGFEPSDVPLWNAADGTLFIPMHVLPGPLRLLEELREFFPTRPAAVAALSRALGGLVAGAVVLCPDSAVDSDAAFCDTPPAVETRPFLGICVQ